MRFQQAI
jgi:DNA-directed RNA polymerase subunit N (RpoN/RPB10)